MKKQELIDQLKISERTLDNRIKKFIANNPNKAIRSKVVNGGKYHYEYTEESLKLLSNAPQNTPAIDLQKELSIANAKIQELQHLLKFKDKTITALEGRIAELKMDKQMTADAHNSIIEHTSNILDKQQEQIRDNAKSLQNEQALNLKLIEANKDLQKYIKPRRTFLGIPLNSNDK